MPSRYDCNNTAAFSTLRIAFDGEKAGEVANQPLWALSEWLDCSWLIRANAAGSNPRHGIVFALCRATRQPAQHHQLPHMRQSIGYWPQKQPLLANVDRLRQSKLVMKRLERRKALLLFSPGQRNRIAPALLALRHAKRPVEQIAQVRQNLCRCPSAIRKSAKSFGRTLNSPHCAICHCSHSVARQFSFPVHGRDSTQETTASMYFAGAIRVSVAQWHGCRDWPTSGCIHPPSQ
jgi:hypothetical protein